MATTCLFILAVLAVVLAVVPRLINRWLWSCLPPMEKLRHWRRTHYYAGPDEVKKHEHHYL